jgi:hypothetical protein
MLGYLTNPRVGAALYNFGHTLLTPGLVLAIALLAAQPRLLPARTSGWIAFSDMGVSIPLGSRTHTSNTSDTVLVILEIALRLAALNLRDFGHGLFFYYGFLSGERHQ